MIWLKIMYLFLLFYRSLLATFSYPFCSLSLLSLLFLTYFPPLSFLGKSTMLKALAARRVVAFPENMAVCVHVCMSACSSSVFFFLSYLLFNPSSFFSWCPYYFSRIVPEVETSLLYRLATACCVCV